MDEKTCLSQAEEFATAGNGGGVFLGLLLGGTGFTSARRA